MRAIGKRSLSRYKKMLYFLSLSSYAHIAVKSIGWWIESKSTAIAVPLDGDWHGWLGSRGGRNTHCPPFADLEMAFLNADWYELAAPTVRPYCEDFLTKGNSILI
jgi:hypothetical protein